MPERSSLFQTVQIAVESTPGTNPGSGFKRLQSLGIEPNIQADIQSFRPYGTKYTALTAVGKEWSTASVSGLGTYTELQYPFSGILEYNAPTQYMDGMTATGAYLWSYTPSNTAADTVKTFTIEQGEAATRAHSITYGLFNEFGMTFSRDSVELSGSMMGRRLTDGITMTGGASTTTLKPILPSQVSVYLDSVYATFNGMSPTKLTRVLGASWSLGNRFGPLWTLDSANTSWATYVETEPSAQATLMVEADAAGMALLDAMRDGSTRYLRIEAVGDRIYDGASTDYYYKLTCDMAVKVSAVGNFSDSDGVYAIEFTFSVVDDSNLGSPFRINLVNTQTAL